MPGATALLRSGLSAASGTNSAIPFRSKTIQTEQASATSALTIAISCSAVLKHRWSSRHGYRSSCLPEVTSRVEARGQSGFQANLPLSLVVSPGLVTHWNAGATITPSAKDAHRTRSDHRQLQPWRQRNLAASPFVECDAGRSVAQHGVGEWGWYGEG